MCCSWGWLSLFLKPVRVCPVAAVILTSSMAAVSADFAEADKVGLPEHCARLRLHCARLRLHCACPRLRCGGVVQALASSIRHRHLVGTLAVRHTLVQGHVYSERDWNLAFPREPKDAYFA